ncbi:MAG: secretin N-terminal domain-containing protein [Candidatus Calescibacterium sp.]|nr:hypothetical protein [Candidatus Calescibacterium sp.]MCX7972583.1 hypothetical protein [bacterium]MDW8195782.1 secretin N-terminal domain-containing protein [Candidatus Calescibacterium sp.]
MKRLYINISKVALLFVSFLFFYLIKHCYSYDALESISSPALDKKFEGSFREVGVKNLLYFITSQIPYNFILEVEEEKKITISFKNSTIKQALRSIVKFANLEMVKISDNTILITSQSKAQNYKPKQKFIVKLIYTPADYVRNIIYSNGKDIEIIVDNFSNSLIIQTTTDKIKPITELIRFLDNPDSEVKTRIFKLNNAKAKDIAQIISNSVYIFQEPVIKEQVKIDPDERTNSIVVTAPKFVIKNIEQLLSDIIDKKLPQVMIDVQVIEINRDKLKDLGIYPGDNSTVTTLTERIPGDNQQGNPQTQTTVVYVQSDKISFPYRTAINLQVLMLEKQGLARILANPKLITSDGKIARVFLGDRVPYLIPQIVPFGTTSAIQQNVQFVEVGINLEFQPFVTKDGYINLRINPKVNYLVKIDPAPWTATREVQTELTVKSEETIIIAGLIKEEERKVKYKIPIVGDIPIIGTIFQAQKKSKYDTEVIFVIKPQIINLQNDTISNNQRK